MASTTMPPHVDATTHASVSTVVVAAAAAAVTSGHTPIQLSLH